MSAKILTFEAHSGEFVAFDSAKTEVSLKFGIKPACIILSQKMPIKISANK